MDLFEALEEQARNTGDALIEKAAIAAFHRTSEKYGKYIAKSRNDLERTARVNLLDASIRKTCQEVCMEFGVTEGERVYDIVYSRLSAKPMPERDTYERRTVDPNKPIGDDSVAGFRSQSYDPDEEVNPPSKQHPKTEQNIEQKADYEKYYNKDWNPNEVSDTAPHELIDADKTIGDTEAIHTQTFPSAGNAADPVTEGNAMVDNSSPNTSGSPDFPYPKAAKTAMDEQGFPQTMVEGEGMVNEPLAHEAPGGTQYSVKALGASPTMRGGTQYLITDNHSGLSGQFAENGMSVGGQLRLDPQTALSVIHQNSMPQNLVQGEQFANQEEAMRPMARWHVLAEMTGLPTEEEMPQVPQTAGSDLDSLTQMIMGLAADVKKAQSGIEEIKHQLGGGSDENTLGSEDVAPTQEYDNKGL